MFQENTGMVNELTSLDKWELLSIDILQSYCWGWKVWPKIQRKLRGGKTRGGNSLEVQWLGLHISTAGGPGCIPGWGTKILQVAQHSQTKQNKTNNNNKKNPTTTRGNSFEGGEGELLHKKGIVAVMFNEIPR